MLLFVRCSFVCLLNVNGCLLCTAYWLIIVVCCYVRAACCLLSNVCYLCVFVVCSLLFAERCLRLVGC